MVGKKIDLLFAAAALGLGALLQATLASRMPVFGARVDIVLLMVVIWAITRELREAVVWGLLGGALLDLFSAAPFGTSVLALGVVAVVASWLNQLFRRSQILALFILVPISTVVCNLLRALVMQRLGWPIDYPATVALVVLPSCLVNTLAAPVVYAVLMAVAPRPARPARFA